ncbi:MAG: DUF2141 domain-containing protein [Myxococcota bacterium]
MIFVLLRGVARAAPLSVVVEGLPTDDGAVICSLFGADDWLGPTARASATATPVGGRAICVFPDVPAGRYATIFVQDLNGNGGMDKGFLGLPREPWGVTRDAPARFGPPAFGDASFDVPAAAPPLAHPK